MDEGFELGEVGFKADASVGSEALEDAALIKDFGLDECASEVEGEGWVETAAVLFQAGARGGRGRWMKESLDATRP